MIQKNYLSQFDYFILFLNEIRDIFFDQKTKMKSVKTMDK